MIGGVSMNISNLRKKYSPVLSILSGLSIIFICLNKFYTGNFNIFVLLLLLLALEFCTNKRTISFKKSLLVIIFTVLILLCIFTIKEPDFFNTKFDYIIFVLLAFTPLKVLEKI